MARRRDFARIVGWSLLALGASAPPTNAAPSPSSDATPSWQAKLSPSLLSAAASGGEASCIITFAANENGLSEQVLSAPGPRWIADTADGIAGDFLGRGLVITRRFSHLPLLAARVPAEALPGLAADSRVVAISPILRARALRTQGNALMRTSVARQMGYDGSGVTVAVLDTGVDYTHPELSPVGTKVINLADTIANDGDAMDEEGHGTNAAGVIAGSSGGVAPASRIAAVRVLDRNGEGTSDQILAGINAVLASVAAGNPYNIRVANMSFGGYDDEAWPPNSGSCDSISQDFATAFRSLTRAGVMVAIAGGNGACTTGVAWPACISSAYAVGAVYDAPVGGWTFSDLQCRDSSCTDSPTAADQIPCYCDSGEKLAFWAPADCATTPRSGGGSTSCFNGTSAASAYASGAAALLFQAAPGQTVGAVGAALQTTGKPITDPRNSLTRNRIDIPDALTALLASCPAPTTPTGFAVTPDTLCDGGQFELSWTAVAEAVSYTVEMATDSQFANPTPMTVSAPTISITPNQTSPVTLYFRVRANSDCGSASPWSATATATYQPTCPPTYDHTTFLSGIGHLKGVFPAFWYSDLAVFNHSAAVAELRLMFYGNSTAGPVTLTLPSLQQLTWPDVLVSLFALAGEDVGAIVVESSEPVTVQARTYSRIADACAGKEGSYGQSYPGLEGGDALAPGQVGYLSGLRSDGSFRTNVEMVNTSAVEATVQVRFFDDSGNAIGSPLQRTVAPNKRVGVTAALPSGLASAWAELQVSPAGSSIIAFASVIDGASSDPTTVPLTVTGTPSAAAPSRP